MPAPQNYSQHSGVTNRGRLGGTALVTVDSAGNSAWHAPLGGTPTLSADGTRLSIAGIALGSAATEQWTIALNGASLTWEVERTMGATAVNATCDRGPTIVINAEYTTTGHVLNRSTQIPSFLDATLAWDPLSGVGFECHISGYAVNNTRDRFDAHDWVEGAPTAAAPGFWTEALSNRTAQNIHLSPSAMQLTTKATLATTGGQTSPLFFALSYPTDPGTGGGDTTMAFGLTTIRPPSRAPASPNAGSPSGPWGSFAMCKDSAGKLCGAAQFFIPPHPHNTTKHHVTAQSCGAQCNQGMPKTCAATVGMPAAELAALPTGAEFSCAMVPLDTRAASAGTLLAAKAVHTISWSIELGDGQGVAPFALSTGDETFDDRMQTFSSVYNMWAGNIFGNSPASIVCLHEMSWFSQISSVFDSPLGPDSVHTALAAELRMFAKHAVQPNGFVYARWNQWAYINMTIHDQMPHYILCNYWQVVNTGDRCDAAAGCWLIAGWLVPAGWC